jgi:CRISPR-associated protein Cmr3
MPTWIIEPRDPLIVRDGRPFGPTPGARARSLTFPCPSTTTGGVRTRAGLNANGAFEETRQQDVLKIEVRGPLLVELAPDENALITNWLVPAPADALLLSPEKVSDPIQRKRLLPLTLPAGAAANLPEDQAPVGQARPDTRKPWDKAPRCWYWQPFVEWLTTPPAEDDVTLDKNRDKGSDAAQIKQNGQLIHLGHDGPTTEDGRMHVSILPDSATAREGMLYQTRGLEFAHRSRRAGGQPEHLWQTVRLGLAVLVAEPPAALRITAGLAPLGGERRVVAWREGTLGDPALDISTCPADIANAIARDGACRVVLLTPACFKEGYYPTWLLEERHGVQPKLRAVAVDRAQVVSGWDFVQNRPKPSRRLAPAGSVFFLTLDGDEAARRKWVASIWMECISDEQVDRGAGFGLAVLGTWDGKQSQMKVEVPNA